MAALGEMASWLPLGSGFTGYATRFSDPALGFALGWNYYFKYIMVTPNQLTAASLVIQFWVDRKRINPGVFITIFLVAIVAINYFGIKFFGEFEFVSLSSPLAFTVLTYLVVAFQYQGGSHHRSHLSLPDPCLWWRTKGRSLRVQVLEQSGCIPPISRNWRQGTIPRNMELHDHSRFRLSRY